MAFSVPVFGSESSPVELYWNQLLKEMMSDRELLPLD